MPVGQAPLWGGGQTVPYPAPQPAPGPPGAPTQTQTPLAPLAQVPVHWPGYGPAAAPTVVDPPLPKHPRPKPVTRPATRPPAPRTRPVSAPAPRIAAPSVPIGRVWRLLPLPHVLLGVGMVLLLAALNIPWGATADGTLVYAQSFTLPFLSDQPEVAGQFAQNIVESAGLLSLALAGLNYFLTLANWMTRRMGVAGCGTCLLFPVMLILMALLGAVDLGALTFGAFDPLASAVVWPWQPGFTLVGAHAELGYYAWYSGVVLNACGMLTQPFVRR
jgi:hypothetical protein